MNILTAQEMAAADRRSVERGVPVATLMENAGASVARFCLRRFPVDGTLGSPVVVLCGKGNNGGDGFVAARYLANAGVWVRVALLGSRTEVKGDAAAMLAQVFEVVEIADDKQLREALKGAVLIIDAVVGTGFKPPLRGIALTARDVVNTMTVPVVAVDLPSGWDADSTEQIGVGAFRADAVVTFVSPKMAHAFGALTTGSAFGPVVVAGIGTPMDTVISASGLRWTGAAKAVAEVSRGINGNKGKFGHVLIVGGAFGKAGAPSMASLAAMRAGAGLVTAAVPWEIVPTVAAVAPELMLQGLGPKGQGIVDKGLPIEELETEQLTALLKGISVVGIGPGLGQVGTTPEFVQTFVERVKLPMVIDADALNAMAGRTELLKRAAAMNDANGRPRTIVLTPHPGEMARLVGMTVKEVEADRLALARRFAAEHGVTLVLKGWRTLVAHPGGRVAVNTTGNPAMAKGGSGDVLTGIVSAMLAQYGDESKGGDVASAVEAAVFLHGLAGDFATLVQDEHTVLATDTVGHLWQAFRARVQDEDGFVWLAGLAAKGRAL